MGITVKTFDLGLRIYLLHFDSTLRGYQFISLSAVYEENFHIAVIFNIFKFTEDAVQDIIYGGVFHFVSADPGNSRKDRPFMS